MRGRKPEPAALKLVRGNPGKRPIKHTDDATPCSGVPPAPEWLTPAARKYWESIAPDLERAGLLKDLDRTALEGLCDAYARWREASEMLAKTSMIVKASTSGYLMPNPLIAIANTAFGQVRAMLAEFGMTPSSRSRVQTSDGNKEPESPTKKYFG